MSLFIGQPISRMMGQYMVATGGNSPNRIKVFDIEPKTAGTYTVVNNVASLTSPTVSFTTAYRWNANGTSLCYTYWTGTGGQNQASVYDKVGNTYEKIADISPGSQGASCSDWHPGNGNLLAITHYASNGATGQLKLFERTGRTTFQTTGTIDVAVTATIGINTVAWNPQGTSLALSCSTSPWVLIYNFNPTTKAFTKITTPFASPPVAYCDQVVWNHDGSSLCVITRSAANRVLVYNRTGDDFVLGANLSQGNDCYAVCWGGAQGEQLVVGISASPRVKFYYRPPGTTSTFLLASNPASLPANNITGMDISDDGLFLAASVYLNANVYYARDPATTSTWVNIGQNITGNPVYGKFPHIFPGKA
jgi:WD40 repeat protein